MTYRPKNLLAIDTNAKTVKGQKVGYMTGILYLAPAKLSGYEVCPMRSKGCTAACLNTAGWGAFHRVQSVRLAKTEWYFSDRASFMAQLIKDIAALERKAARAGFIPVVRLNGTSDIPWERVKVTGAKNIMAMFPHIQFYDYTKVTQRALQWARGDMPKNYHLTFSAHEANSAACYDVLNSGGNVAVVFSEIPESVYGYSVINGDTTDLRFKDLPQEYQQRGVIIALKAKGKARGDKSGFVRHNGRI